MIGGVRVRALYTYIGEDEDELSFKAGDMLYLCHNMSCIIHVHKSKPRENIIYLLCECVFKGEEFLKVEDEDDQGWSRGVKEGGVEGYYPANYVLPIQ